MASGTSYLESLFRSSPDEKIPIECLQYNTPTFPISLEKPCRISVSVADCVEHCVSKSMVVSNYVHESITLQRLAPSTSSGSRASQAPSRSTGTRIPHRSSNSKKGMEDASSPFHPCQHSPATSASRGVYVYDSRPLDCKCWRRASSPTSSCSCCWCGRPHRLSPSTYDPTSGSMASP